MKKDLEDSSYPIDKLDSYENLILLCRLHHKMVDDQYITFSADILRQIKTNHEVWLSQKLKDDKFIPPLKFRRIEKNVPDFLVRLTTGKEIINLISGTMAHSFDYEELKSQSEVEMIGKFLQNLQDIGDIYNDLEANDHVQYAFKLSIILNELDKQGFSVFGGREVQLLEGGNQSSPSDWPISIIKILRKENQSIKKI